jgi:general secretion pathway protein G
MGGHKSAFTLVEILIVVIILSILAAIMIPQFTNAAEDSKLSNLMSNLQSIRVQLELYKMNHNEVYPTDISTQMTSKTDIDGTVNPSGSYGPYLHIFPANPFIVDAVEGAKTSGAAGEGWYYNPATGAILPNTGEHMGL